ncbi:hypothetical protein BJX68DRAFT_257766 [Aspergillus pseudodeflectus]|uniref:Uncharacterized protein n=1 Tax=Aspergillus pseudodeflectus TaxID=176178 RepID=A0ABR4JR16_9EURO
MLVVGLTEDITSGNTFTRLPSAMMANSLNRIQDMTTLLESTKVSIVSPSDQSSNTTRSSKPKDAFRIHKPTKRLKEFAGNLQNALIRCIPTENEQPYDKVSVLALHWFNDDLNVVPLEQELLDVFKNIYGFNVESYTIPKAKPMIYLNSKLANWTVEYNDKRTLRICVYSGHASPAGPTDENWYFGGRTHSDGSLAGPTLDWNRVRRACEMGEGDICYLFGCGSAGSGALYDGPELMCVSGLEQTAGDNWRFSFTRALIDTLQDLDGQQCTMANLFAILYRNSSQHNVSTSPLHVMGKNAPTRIKVLISVHLSDDRPNLQAWKNWLTQNIPAAVLSAEIKIESMFESRSTIALVTLPLELWTVLNPTDESFTFIGFVTSSNRLGGDYGAQLPARGSPGPQSQENNAHRTPPWKSLS